MTLTFIGVSAAVYLIAAILTRKADKDTTSLTICLGLPLIITVIMVTSSRAPSMRDAGRAGGMFAVLIFMFASVPTWISIASLRDLIAEGVSAGSKKTIWRIIGLIICAPLSVYINKWIAAPLWHHMHHMTILTYVLLAAIAALGVFLIIKGHQHKRYISNLIKMKEMN